MRTKKELLDETPPDKSTLVEVLSDIRYFLANTIEAQGYGDTEIAEEILKKERIDNTKEMLTQP